MRRKSIQFVALVAAMVGAFSATAQLGTGEIGGSVRDPLGGLLPDVAIVAERASTGIRYSAVTNASGEYLIAQLPPGDYKLSASGEGFKDSVLPLVQVHPGDHLQRQFSLELGGRNDVVTVDAAVDTLELGSGFYNLRPRKRQPTRRLDVSGRIMIVK